MEKNKPRKKGWVKRKEKKYNKWEESAICGLQHYLVLFLFCFQTFNGHFAKLNNTQEVHTIFSLSTFLFCSPQHTFPFTHGFMNTYSRLHTRIYFLFANNYINFNSYTFIYSSTLFVINNVVITRCISFLLSLPLIQHCLTHTGSHFHTIIPFLNIRERW